MRSDACPPSGAAPSRRAWRGVARALAASGCLTVLAGCATQPQHLAGVGSRVDPSLGVSASERVVFGDDPVPRGGGSYLVGHPYVIGGRTYVPSERAQGYTAVGTASWYGDAFHGRRTANGEVFDRRSITAAHPTLPLPSYVRVTNLVNGRSMIVRVNDRGPYHGDRIMDVSQRVAEALDFRRSGTARIRVDYVGRASLEGSDDEKLVATLRTDGAPAETAGFGGDLRVAAAPGAPSPGPTGPAEPVRVARDSRIAAPDQRRDGLPATPPEGRAPLPPVRPFDLSDRAVEPQPARPSGDRLAALLQRN